MTLQKEDLLKLARLSRLALKEQEINSFLTDLNEIVDYIDLLKEVDVDNIEPMSYAQEHHLFLRDDEAKEVLGRKCIESSGGYEDGMIKVPKIIE